MARDPGDELVEWVDVDGTVIELVTRRRMRAQNLRHRATYVAVLRAGRESGPELVVHRRADWKDVYPGYWDVAFGGVADVGEDWEQAARRELAEEAGVVDTDLHHLGSGLYDEDDGRVIGQVWVTQHDAALDCPDGEVVAVDHVPLARLDEWLSSHLVCPDSRRIVLPLLSNHLTRLENEPTNPASAGS